MKSFSNERQKVKVKIGKEFIRKKACIRGSVLFNKITIDYVHVKAEQTMSYSGRRS